MEALIVSNVVLWLLVIALGVVVYALTRQIGVLHERVAPAGALTLSADVMYFGIDKRLLFIRGREIDGNATAPMARAVDRPCLPSPHGSARDARLVRCACAAC
jgi:hypothetical protein